MEAIRLVVNRREKSAKAKNLRKAEQVPCEIYGNKTENVSASCKEQELHRVYKAAGESTIVELDLEGKQIPVLIHSLSFDPVSDRYQHVDFYVIDMKKELTTRVPVHTSGESPAIKTLAAILVTVQNEVTVKCLPKDLPHSFTVDLSKLVEFHDTITVADIKVPAGVKIEDAPEKVLYTVQEPRKIEEELPKPAEGEVPAEGAAAEGAPAAEGAAATAEAPAKAEGKEKKK